MNIFDEYAMYLRKSRKDLDLEAMGQGETLARHRAELTALAEKMGIKVVDVYEEMVSGESIQARPEMQRLLDAVCAGKYKGVLVMEVERLARGNTKDQGEVAEAFSISETLIVTPSKTYDPNDEFDEEYFEFGLFMSRREYKTIRRRMQRGLIASFKEGNYLGSLPPYGYDIVRLNKKERTLMLNEQSKYVEMIFHWFVDDRMTCGEIARKLTDMGIQTQTGKTYWNRATVKDILKNVLYTGKVRWYRRKTSKEMDEGRILKKKRRYGQEHELVVPGKHPAIVSDKLFDIAQSLFDGQVPVSANAKLSNPLARLIFCKYCGRAISLQHDSKRTTTKPRMVHADGSPCKLKSSTVESVMDALISALQAYIADFEFKMTNEEIKAQTARHADVIKSVESELSKQEKKREQLFDFLESGIYTKAEFMERKSVLTEKIKALEESLDKLKKDAPQKVDYQEKILKFSETIKTLQDPDIPAKYKNDLLKEIVSRIEYDAIDLGRQKGSIPILDVYLK